MKIQQNNCTRITNSLFGNLSENVLIKPQLIKYKSFDGLEIPAFLYKPSNTTTTPTTALILKR